MTLEALVRTVDAIERTECVEARRSLCIEKLSPSFSSAVAVSGQSLYCCCRLRSASLALMQNLQIRNVIKQMKRIPPMTPPAIGPPADPDDGADDGEAPIRVQLVTAQVVHPPPINEQISLGLQAGHGGGWAGQLAHRLKRVGVERSASTTTRSALKFKMKSPMDLPKRPKLPKSILMVAGGMTKERLERERAEEDPLVGVGQDVVAGCRFGVGWRQDNEVRCRIV